MRARRAIRRAIRQLGAPPTAARAPGYPGIYGATAADNELDGSWKVLTGGGAKDGGVALVGVMDGVKFGASMLDGNEMYTPTGKLATVTKVTGETGSLTGGREVLEIDYKPALDTLEGWYGVGTGDVPAPLRASRCTKNQSGIGGGHRVPAGAPDARPRGALGVLLRAAEPGQQVAPPPPPDLSPAAAPPLTPRAALAFRLC